MAHLLGYVPVNHCLWVGGHRRVGVGGWVGVGGGGGIGVCACALCHMSPRASSPKERFDHSKDI